MNNVFGSVVASVVAGFVASAPLMAQDAAKAPEAEKKMACQNNSCKGKAACKGFGNETCAGKNTCKGHGIVKADDAKACKKAHGKWAEVK